MDTFAKRLEVARQRAGMTQTELAHAAKVTQQAAQKWLSGESMPRAPTVALLARAVGVSPSWLQFGDSPPGQVAAPPAGALSFVGYSPTVQVDRRPGDDPLRLACLDLAVAEHELREAMRRGRRARGEVERALAETIIEGAAGYGWAPGISTDRGDLVLVRDGDRAVVDLRSSPIAPPLDDGRRVPILLRASRQFPATTADWLAWPFVGEHGPARVLLLPGALARESELPHVVVDWSNGAPVARIGDRLVDLAEWLDRFDFDRPELP